MPATTGASGVPAQAVSMEALSPVASKLWIPCARRVAMTQRPRRMKSPIVSHSHRAAACRRPARPPWSAFALRRENYSASMYREVPLSAFLSVQGAAEVSASDGEECGVTLRSFAGRVPRSRTRSASATTCGTRTRPCSRARGLPHVQSGAAEKIDAGMGKALEG